MRPIPAYILAGGHSSRFGSDKARATLEGAPLIRRIADGAAKAAGDVTVVADVAGKYGDLGLRTIADLRPGLGPLGGLHASLHDASARGHAWVFLASCDLIRLNPDWIRRLAAHADDGVHFAAFRGTFWEPLIACYRVSLIPLIEEHLRNGTYALWKLLEASRGAALPLPPDWPQRVQVNTEAELAAAREELWPGRAGFNDNHNGH